MCLVADGASRAEQGVVTAREQAAETRLVCDATCKVVQQARGCQELKRKQDRSHHSLLARKFANHKYKVLE